MPFGLLWCCYLVQARATSRCPLGHQCLSAFCGVVTRQRTRPRPPADPVTNAFRPFVVLLPVLIQAYLETSAGVTNAFRPFVVLLPLVSSNAKTGPIPSPMPFGLLWCCYCRVRCRGFPLVQASPMPFGLLWCCYPNKDGVPSWPGRRHQCLSAFCGVVTPRMRIIGHAVVAVSPMPFGLLWCCYEEVKP